MYWDQAYPNIRDVDANVESAASADYRVVDTFVLPAENWWTDLYRPLERRLVVLREKYVAQAEALAEIEEAEREIDMFRTYSDSYGYVFYIMRKTESLSK